MFRGVRDLESHGKLSASAVWALERRSLRTLHKTQTLYEAGGHDFHDERIKRTHVVALTGAADGSLVAAATSDGVVEVHEPRDATGTHRVTLRTGHAGATHAAWGAGPDDAVYVALAHSPAVWRFDLESCRECVASHIYTIPAPSRATRRSAGTDIATMPEGVAVATPRGEVFIFDARARRPSATVVAGAGRVAIDVVGDVLFAGEAGTLKAFDRRILRAAPSRTFEAGGHMNRAVPLVRRRVAAGPPDQTDFVSLNCVPGAPGQVAFHMRDGSSGIVNMLGRREESAAVLREANGVLDGVRMTGSDSGLRAYGSSLRDCGTWWVYRHRAKVVPGSLGLGARIYAPLIRGNGFRVIAHHDGDPVETVRIETAKPVAAVLPVDGGVVVGYASARVDMFAMGRRVSTTERNSVEQLNNG